MELGKSIKVGAVKPRLHHPDQQGGPIATITIPRALKANWLPTSNQYLVDYSRIPRLIQANTKKPLQFWGGFLVLSNCFGHPPTFLFDSMKFSGSLPG
jgi:hypothetical protein